MQICKVRWGVRNMLHDLDRDFPQNPFCTIGAPIITGSTPSLYDETVHSNLRNRLTALSVRLPRTLRHLSVSFLVCTLRGSPCRAPSS